MNPFDIVLAGAFVLCVIVGLSALAWGSSADFRTTIRFRAMRIGLRRQLQRDLKNAANDDVRLLLTYHGLLKDLAVAKLISRRYHEIGQNYSPEVRGIAKEGKAVSFCERWLEESTTAAAGFISNLSDTQISMVAEAMGEHLVDDHRLDPAIFRTFFRNEADLLRHSPHMVVMHRSRFNALMKGIQADLAKAQDSQTP